jgi:phosphonate transport system ATP-binding protein
VALRNVDLTVGKGQVIALIGPSGAGKSTLIRCINRLIEPTAGSIIVDREDITRLNGPALRRARRRIGMIFQEHALVDRLTVMENVLSGQLGYVGFWRSQLRRFPQPTIDRAFEILERVGIVDYVDKRADQLSGGQRQRVGIARALLQDPQLLLVDEPTASLDPKTSRQVMRLLLGLAAEHQLTAVINIHDVPLAAMFVPRIVGLKQGEIVFDGDPKRLTPDVLTTIYGEENWEPERGGEDDEEEDGDAGPDEFGLPETAAVNGVANEAANELTNEQETRR